MPTDPLSVDAATKVKSLSQRRADQKELGSWPERRVIRVGVSPLNPKVKWAQLDCGHDVYRYRKPRIGSTIVCDKCPKGSR